jgi:hypothetical protein
VHHRLTGNSCLKSTKVLLLVALLALLVHCQCTNLRTGDVIFSFWSHEVVLRSLIFLPWISQSRLECTPPHVVNSVETPVAAQPQVPNRTNSAPQLDSCRLRENVRIGDRPNASASLNKPEDYLRTGACCWQRACRRRRALSEGSTFRSSHVRRESERRVRFSPSVLIRPGRRPSSGPLRARFSMEQRDMGGKFLHGKWRLSES